MATPERENIALDKLGDRPSVSLEVGNYYGMTSLVKDGDRWLLMVENYDWYYGVVVSDTFAAACIAEFGDPS